MSEQSYRSVSMLQLLFRLVAALPLRAVHAIGGTLGSLVFWLSPTYRRRLEQNLAQAGYQGRALIRAAAREAGRQAVETPWVWLRPAADVAAHTIVDATHWDQLLAEGRPVLVLTPHLGCFEVIPKHYSGRPEAVQRPMTVLYRVPKKRILRDAVEAGRAAANVRLAPAELRGVRLLIRAMRANEVVGILPDQVPSRGDGVWAPFFGRSAYTMTLPARLATQHDAIVTFIWGERLPRGRGWCMHFERLDAPLSGDPVRDAERINRVLERLIRRQPAQYLWGYNRYKAPAGAPPAPESA